MLLECIVDAHILKDNSLSEQPLGSIVDTGETGMSLSISSHLLKSVHLISLSPSLSDSHSHN